MRRLAGLALALIVMLGACSDDNYSPYDFKRVPGYTPSGGISSPARITNIPLESQKR